MTLERTGSNLMSLKYFSVSCRCTCMQISEQSPPEAGASCRGYGSKKNVHVSSGKCILPAGVMRAGRWNVEIWTAANGEILLLQEKKIWHICGLQHISVTLSRANSLLRIITSEQQIINLDVSLFTWTNTERLRNLMA